MQELTIRETRTVGQWTLEITREEVDGKIVRYIVSASNATMLTTLNVFGVDRSASVAFANALRYLRIVEEGIERTGELPCYRPQEDPRRVYA